MKVHISGRVAVAKAAKGPAIAAGARTLAQVKGALRGSVGIPWGSLRALPYTLNLAWCRVIWGCEGLHRIFTGSIGVV